MTFGVKKLIGIGFALACSTTLHGASASDFHQDYFHVLRNPVYAYNLLDDSTNINRRQLVVLQARQRGQLASNRLYVSAAQVVLADFQQSNRANEFGYLMRHPTSNNQIGFNTSEIILFNTHLAFTGTIEDWFNAVGVLWFNPSQSFGAGGLTTVTRNCVEVRQGYIVIGNLDYLPVNVSAGKMTAPFGLMESVSPFTLSSVWHAFAGLAYGAKINAHVSGIDASIMFVQGGAQFRALNSGCPTPTRLENGVADISYTYENDWMNVRVGASYEAGSAYNQDYPVQHFNPGNLYENPAWDLYTRLQLGRWLFIGEVAQTTRVWPGTHNPYPPLNKFKASRVSSFGVGVRYAFDLGNHHELAPSIDFSQFKAGPACSPWKQQSQLVLGLEYIHKQYLRCFLEYVHTEGFVPLNFISGGSIKKSDGAPDHTKTISNQEARSNVITAGIKYAL